MKSFQRWLSNIHGLNLENGLCQKSKSGEDFDRTLNIKEEKEMKRKRSIIVIGFIVLTMGLGYSVLGIQVARAAVTIATVSVSPSLVSAGTKVILTADISASLGINHVSFDVFREGESASFSSGPIWAPGAGTNWPTEWNFSYAIDTTGLAVDGTYYVNLYAWDKFFSWANPTWWLNMTMVQTSLTVDSTGPVIRNVELSDYTVERGTQVIVTADISDPLAGINHAVVDIVGYLGSVVSTSGPIYAPGAGTNWPTEWNLSYTIDTTDLADGTYNIHLYAFDRLFTWRDSWWLFNFSGFGAAQAILTVVDSPPTVTITHPKEGDFAAASLNVTGNCWDAVDGPLPVEVTINPVVFEPNENGDFGGQLVGPSTGEIVITATAIDSAGNKGSDSVTILRVHDNRKSK